MIERAHTQGVQVVGCTLTPYEGAGYYRDDLEMIREAVNTWIRTPGNFDAFVDFEAASAIADRKRSAPSSIRAIICTLTTRGMRRWQRRSIWVSSAGRRPRSKRILQQLLKFLECQPHRALSRPSFSMPRNCHKSCGVRHRNMLAALAKSFGNRFLKGSHGPKMRDARKTGHVL